MNLTGVNEEELAGAMRRSLKDHWQVFVVQGLLFALLGTLAIAALRCLSLPRWQLPPSPAGC